MSDQRKPQDFDFYKEALKAFDAPIPQNLPKAEVPVTSAAAGTAPIPVEEALPPRSSFLKKWWPALLCCLVFVALLATLLPRGKGYTVRSENWVYGTISFAYEDLAIVTDREGQRWYVQCKGVTLPEEYQTDFTQFWVFYDGEPQETTELNCAKKIKATLIKSTYPERMEGMEKYGLVYDDIEFDLDGDGEVEHWYLCNELNSLLPPLLNSSFDSSASAHRWEWSSSSSLFLLNQYVLLALDNAGKELYHIRFQSPSYQLHAFGNSGERLTLTAITADGHVTMDIRLENGEVAVYQGVNRLSSDQVLPTEPYDDIITIGSEPTPPPTSETAIYFSIEGDAATGWISPEGNHVADFKKALDVLYWEDVDQYPDLEIFGTFQIRMDGEQYSYLFTADGKVIHNGTVRQMSQTLFLNMINMMGSTAYEPEIEYLGWFPDGKTMSLTLDGGDFHLEVHPEYGLAVSTYGIYGRVGDLLILANGMPGQDNPGFLYVFQWADGSLTLRPELSVMDSGLHFDYGVQLLNLEHIGMKVQIGLGGTESDPETAQTPCFYLDAEQASVLRSLLDSQLWIPDVQSTRPNAVGYVTLQLALDEDDGALWSQETYYILPDMRLYHNARICLGRQELLTHIMELMQQHAQATFAEGSYVCEDAEGRTINLHFRENGTYQCTVLGGEIFAFGSSNVTHGNYAILGNQLYLYSDFNGNGFYMLFTIEDDRIVYNDALSDFKDLRLADGDSLKLQGQEVLIKLSCAPSVAPGAQSVVYETDYCAVDTDLTTQLLQMLESLSWRSADQLRYSIYMNLHIRLGNEPVFYTVCSDRIVKRGGLAAVLTQSQWELLMQVMKIPSKRTDELIFYYAQNDDGMRHTLCLNSDNQFTLFMHSESTAGTQEAITGYYIHVGKAIFFSMNNVSSHTGFLMLEEDNGNLYLDPVLGFQGIPGLPEDMLFAYAGPLLYG